MDQSVSSMSKGSENSFLKEQIRDLSEELGFEAFGVTSIQVPLRTSYYKQWIEAGKCGEMLWMEKNLDRRLNPSEVLPGAKSILCFAFNYTQAEANREGRITTYALGKDYHKILYKKLKQICLFLREKGAVNKPYVDTGPVLEKAIAAEAGIGWQGKHTNLIHPRLGNFFFLGQIFTTLELEPDKAIKNRCGSCSRCIDICPTNAITAPYELDARKCIAYLTIEHKGSIPLEYREKIGDNLYGCDDCLKVCPWNRWAEQSHEERFAARDYPALQEMLLWDENTFRELFAGTAIKRIGMNNWKRNICIVLGNTGQVKDLAGLNLLRSSEDAALKEVAHWAIQRIESRSINA